MSVVSIVIPAFNVENYLAKSIESALSQSYSNTEIIIVNDGSTDSTSVIAKKVIQTDCRVTLFEQKNLGLSAARNSGIRLAKGEIVAFLDSDDWWHPEYLEKMVRILKKNDRAGICFSRIHYADEAGTLLPLYTRGPVKNIQKRDFIYMNPLSCGSNIVIKKKFLDDTGFFDESLKSLEDQDFLYRAASHPYFTISGIKEYLVYYRIRQGLSHNTDRMLDAWKQFMQKVKSVNPQDFNKHYFPALLSQHIYLARRMLQAGCTDLSRKHLFFCVRHPFALFKLALKYPILALYSFPTTYLKSLFAV